MKAPLTVRETQAKSVLNKSKIHDYCVNPYTGCQVGCRYCYARLFIPRYSGHAEPWGTFVDAKVNAPDVLRRQLVRAKRGTVWVSSVCDCYQPLETRYRLTRRCLEELAAVQFPVSVQTKSVLALRDLDVFERFRDLVVTFTITTDDEEVARLVEPLASPIAERIQALETLHRAGIRTSVFIGPVLPGDPAALVGALEGKVDEALIDRLNYADTVRRFYEGASLGAALEDGFYSRMTAAYARELRKRRIPYRVVC